MSTSVAPLDSSSHVSANVLSKSCLVLSLALALTGCMDGWSAPFADGGTADADTSHPTPVRRRTVPLTVDPNGLWWDASSGTLYIADDDGNQILKWTDADGIGLVAKLPAAPAGGLGLGQLVVTADGTIVIPRFGFGTDGDVVFIKNDGAMGTVPGLAKDRRRIGLTVAEDGTLFDSFFLKVGADRVGTVSTLTLAGTEMDAITALKKPVGVLAVGSRLFVSDQDLGQILTASITKPTATAVFATLPTPDLLAAGPNGSVFTGGLQGGVRRISAAGEVTVFQEGLKQPRGVAWDPGAGRLFIANHDGEPADGVAHTLEIVPVD